MSDQDFLLWVHSRLSKVYGENVLCDYMHRLRAIALAQPKDKVTKWGYLGDPKDVSTRVE
jgi:hypothetical protein